MKEEKTQNTPIESAGNNGTPATEQQPSKPAKLLYRDWLTAQEKTVFKSPVGVYVLPAVKIQRTEFYTNSGDRMYGYYVPVKYHGEEVQIRLTTPNDYDSSTRRSNKDRYGYKFFDALYSDCSQCNLGLQFVYYPDSDRLRSINYFMCGYDEFGNLDALPVEIDKSSSESVLRSAIGRLRNAYDLDLPEF